MGWFDFLGSPPTVPAHAPAPGGPRELVLYKYDTCPYCLRVLRALDELGLEVTLRDTMRDAGARDALVAATGRTQVPCLFIDGQPLFESADIVAWLRAHAAASAAPVATPPARADG